ncbi:MAG: lasso peptide biosynthesis B2 protein [bacterium]
MGKTTQHALARTLRLLARGTRKVVLNPGESFLIARMAVWVSVLSIIVHRQPLPRALQIVSAKTQGTAQPSPGETAQRLARAIDILLGADLLIFKPICWKRAAILHRYLALNGIATRIVFGVRKGSKGEVDGHAWLEAAGQPILEATAPNYKVTYTFPSRDDFNLDIASLDTR